jgi:DNA (cytosine-5)-methyltransferase 1
MDNSLAQTTDASDSSVAPLRVVELFAGVGGFRRGLETSGWETVWSNQWEPATKRQHASEVYVHRFGTEGHSNEDISCVLTEVENGSREIPEHDLLVGGFPCQDYSVATALEHATGIEGKKGVLWWEIYRLLKISRPPMILLENVDRLLKSPATQRGRDFAIMLACLNELGYTVEWRVVNAAEYGLHQRRRRVFIVGRQDRPLSTGVVSAQEWILHEGDMARAFPIDLESSELKPEVFELDSDLTVISDEFGMTGGPTPFGSAGICFQRQVTTVRAQPDSSEPRKSLQDILLTEDEVPESFYIPENQVTKWEYLKGAKQEKRTSKKNGYEYRYSEGALPFPDKLGQPSRTVLTGEGGTSASRFKHVVMTPSGKMRRLTPVELERLNGFPDDWTKLDGITDAKRAFLMGNALVVGVVERIGKVLRDSMTTTEESNRYDKRRELTKPSEVGR